MSEPDSTWVITFSGRGSATEAYFSNLYHGDEKFVATGTSYTSGEDPTFAFLLAASPSSDGPWSTTTIDGVENAYPIHALAFGDGLWVTITLSGDFVFTVRTATDPTGAWTERSTLAYSSSLRGQFEEAVSVGYDGTRWAAQVHGQVYTTTDPTGSWTAGRDFLTTETTDDGEPVEFRMFLLDDGQWILVHQFPLGDGFGVFTTADPSGSWTERTPSLIADALTPSFINVFKSHEGYVLTSGSGTYLAESPDGPWVNKHDWDTEFPISFGRRLRVGYGNGYYILTGEYGSAGRPILGFTTTLEEQFEFVDPAFKDDPTSTNQDLFSVAVFSGDEWAVAGRNSPNAVIWTPNGGGDGWGLTL